MADYNLLNRYIQYRSEGRIEAATTVARAIVAQSDGYRTLDILAHRNMAATAKCEAADAMLMGQDDQARYYLMTAGIYGELADLMAGMSRLGV